MQEQVNIGAGPPGSAVRWFRSSSDQPRFINTITFDSRENAPTLVMVHGYGASQGFFFRNFDALAARFRVIAIDQLGSVDAIASQLYWITLSLSVHLFNFFRLGEILNCRYCSHRSSQGYFNFYDIMYKFSVYLLGKCGHFLSCVSKFMEVHIILFARKKIFF